MRAHPHEERAEQNNRVMTTDRWLEIGTTSACWHWYHWLNERSPSIICNTSDFASQQQPQLPLSHDNERISNVLYCGQAGYAPK